MNIENKFVVLVLNSLWLPIGVTSIRKAIVAMNSEDGNGNLAAKGLSINYEFINGEYNFEKPIEMTPLTFDKWLDEPIRSFDLFLNTPNRKIRCPTVIITNFNKMIMKTLRPTKDGIYKRDGGRCGYTNEPLSKHKSTVDHILPKSRKGSNDWTNLVLCSQEVNRKKSNKTPEEAGLVLLKKPTKPHAVPAAQLIVDIKSRDWKHFFVN